MKKTLILAATLLLALTAAAQNKTIDTLADKYSETEGATVMNLDSEAIKGLAGFIPQGKGTINLDDGTTYGIGQLIDDIEKVTIIVLKKTDEVFEREVQNALASVRYSPILSHNDGGNNVKISSIDIKRGKLRGNKEIVVTVTGDSETILLRVIADIDMELLAKLAQEVQKRS